MQDPPLWFSINAGLLLYLTLASLSYWVGRVPKKLYKAEVREFIEREYRRTAPVERARAVKPIARVALDTRALLKKPLREVVVVADEDDETSENSSSSGEEEEGGKGATMTRAEREAYRFYFRSQAERAQAATEVTASPLVVEDSVVVHLSGCGQPSRVTRL